MVLPNYCDEKDGYVFLKYPLILVRVSTKDYACLATDMSVFIVTCFFDGDLV